MAALLAAVLAGVLGLAAQTSLWALVAVAIGVQLLLATGIASTGRADRPSWATWLVVAGAGVAATVTTVTAEVVDLGTLAPVVAGGVLAALLRELLRRDGRAALTGSVSMTTAGVLLAVLTATWSVTVVLPHGETLVTVGAVGIAGCSLVWAVPGPRGALGPLGVVVAAVAGWVVLPMLAGPYAASAGAVLAAAGAVAAAVGLAAATWWAAGAREHLALVATLPLALAAPVVLLVGQLADALT